MNKCLKDILIALGIIFAYLINGVLAYIPLAFLNIDVEKMNITFRIIYLIFFEILFIFVLWMIYKRDMNKDFNDFRKNIGKYLKKYIEYWAIMLILMCAANAIIILIKYLFNQGIYMSKNEEYVHDLLRKYPIYTIISTVLLAPLEEEIVFRKTVRKIFTNKYIYIIVSGLFFGLMHVITSSENILDFIYIIPYSIPGFILAYVYQKSDNIFASVSIHFIHNSVLMAIILLRTLI